MPNYRSYYNHKVNDLRVLHGRKCKCKLVLIFMNSTPKIQRLGCWWRHEIFTSSNQSYGRPCFTPLRDGRQSSTRHSGEMQEQKEPQIWNSPLKSVLPAHVEDWWREVAVGLLKHFLRTHKSLSNGFPLARSSSGGGVYFLLPTLKKMQKPMGLYV